MKRYSTLAAILILAASIATAQNAPSSTDAPLGARDVLDIKVLQDSNLNTKTTIGDDGKLTMPLLGKVDVSGMTATQAEQHIKSLLESKYMTKADVVLQVLEYGNKPISVIGAVVHPGTIGASGNITLLQAITQAGGLASGYGKSLYVLRTASNGLTERIDIDIEDLMVNGNPDLNLPLTPNDVINVPVDTPLTIYVLGEVMHPGTVQFRRSQTPTLLQALAGAGGPTDRAGRRVVIKRMTNGKEQTIPVNYKSILSGNRTDVMLMDNDTIYITESLF
jgi:polysaccharide export outer membrane protein